MTDILAIDAGRHENADLMCACWDLGYLGPVDGQVLDATYGYGSFWKCLRISGGMEFALTQNDADPKKGKVHHDFRSFPADWAQSFDAVVFDPPYKLNGTPDVTDGGADERYGVHVPERWQDRMQLCLDGIAECAAVVKPKGYLLIKCQAQVASAHVRWQDRVFADHAESFGFRLEDRFDLLGGRAQPSDRTRMGCPECGGRITKVKAGRKCRLHGVVAPVDVAVVQAHASRNHSTLLVLRAPK